MLRLAQWAVEQRWRRLAHLPSQCCRHRRVLNTGRSRVKERRRRRRASTVGRCRGLPRKPGTPALDLA